MEFNDYQEKAQKTAVYPIDAKVIYPVLGLNGEAGEVAEKIKKIIRDKNSDFSNPLDILEIVKELGDCLWYLSNIASNLGVTLDQVAKINLEKLISRKKRKVLKGEGDNR